MAVTISLNSTVRFRPRVTGGGHGFEQFPLLIGEIGWVWFSAHSKNRLTNPMLSHRISKHALNYLGRPQWKGMGYDDLQSRAFILDTTARVNEFFEAEQRERDEITRFVSVQDGCQRPRH